MKPVVLFGERKAEILPLLKKYKIDVVEDTSKTKPRLVICYGGDGTLIFSEYVYPNIPKLILKGSKICKKCENLPNEEILRRLVNGKFKIVNIWKLEGTSPKGKIYGMNDITVHNADVRHAVRVRVLVDDVDVGDEIIGDGVIVATPFGASGYYRSITKSIFEVGMGLAFNNSTEPVDHMVLDENKRVKVVVTRGPAVVYADNTPQSFVLENGDWIEIKKSSKTAKLVRVT